MSLEITLRPTARVRKLNGQDVREWHGEDERGIKVIALVAAVAPQTHDATVAQRYSSELKDCGFARQPAIDLRNVI